MMHVYELQYQAIKLLQHPGWFRLKRGLEPCIEELGKLSRQAADIHEFVRRICRV